MVIRKHMLELFERYRDIRPLHSFPTRRSSDLHEILAEEQLAPAQRLAIRRRRPAVRPLLVAGALLVLATGARSEEHTSELQSPDHLVCRLLLEKKNPHIHDDEYYDLIDDVPAD